MIEFAIILGLAVLVGAAINAAKRKDSGFVSKVLAGALILFFLFYLLSI